MRKCFLQHIKPNYITTLVGGRTLQNGIYFGKAVAAVPWHSGVSKQDRYSRRENHHGDKCESVYASCVLLARYSCKIWVKDVNLFA